ncbi:MAG: hypothetical protein AB7G28_20740 [Pirellulales bacterium]
MSNNQIWIAVWWLLGMVCVAIGLFCPPRNAKAPSAPTRPAFRNMSSELAAAYAEASTTGFYREPYFNLRTTEDGVASMVDCEGRVLWEVKDAVFHECKGPTLNKQFSPDGVLENVCLVHRGGQVEEIPKSEWHKYE